MVLAHGSGPSDKDETIGSLKPFRDLAEGLSSHGIAVFRFDKRTFVYGNELAAKKDISLEEETIEDAVNAGIAKGYTEGYLRKSSVEEPLFERRNTRDNTPAILHTKLVAGDRISLRLAPKGAGSENKGGLRMLVPADGIEGVKRAVLDIVSHAGASPCPPMVVGVGIGGNMELACLCAKKACARDVDTHNPDPRYAKLEDELLELVNGLGIGPAGLGGGTTAFKVNVEFCATHIACLPVAVNINCNAARHAHAVI